MGEPALLDGARGRRGRFGNNGWSHSFLFDATVSSLMETKLGVSLETAPIGLFSRHFGSIMDRSDIPTPSVEGLIYTSNNRLWPKRFRKSNSNESRITPGLTGRQRKLARVRKFEIMMGLREEEEDETFKVDDKEGAQLADNTQLNRESFLSSPRVEDLEIDVTDEIIIPNDSTAGIGKTYSENPTNGRENNGVSQGDVTDSVRRLKIFEELGKWEETLDVVEEFINEKQCSFACWAMAADRISARAAVRLQADLRLADELGHSPFPPKHMPPKSKGIRASGNAGSRLPRPYWLYIHVTRLSTETVNPFVRVRALGRFWETDRVKAATWDPIRIDLPCQRKTRVSLEIYDDRSGLFSKAEVLIGQTVFYRFTPERRSWFHMYGGWDNQKVGKRDISVAMVKGCVDVGPPSQYKGSFCLEWETRKLTCKINWPPTQDEVPVFLEARLFRGLYILDPTLKNEEVVVTLRIGGSEIQTEKGPSQDVMTFRGRIHEQGVLHFYSDQNLRNEPAPIDVEPAPTGCKTADNDGSPGTVAWMQKIAEVSVLPGVQFVYVYIQAAKDQSKKPPTVFGRMELIDGITPFPSDVERQSQSVSRSSRSDKGVIRLAGNVPFPSWHHLSFDRSLSSASSDDKTGGDRFAGCLLGWAKVTLMGTKPVWCSTKELAGLSSIIIEQTRDHVSCVSADSTISGQLSSITQLYKGKKGPLFAYEGLKTRKLWLHMDILQAECLPASSDDALSEPTWELRADCRRVSPPREMLSGSCVHPTYLHRVCVPMTLYMPTGHVLTVRRQGERQMVYPPLPPLLLILRDLRKKNPEEDNEMVKVLIKSPDIFTGSRRSPTANRSPSTRRQHTGRSNATFSTEPGRARTGSSRPDRRVSSTRSAFNPYTDHRAKWYLHGGFSCGVDELHNDVRFAQLRNAPRVMGAIAITTTSPQQSRGIITADTETDSNEPEGASETVETIEGTMGYKYYKVTVEILGVRRLAPFTAGLDLADNKQAAEALEQKRLTLLLDSSKETLSIGFDSGSLPNLNAAYRPPSTTPEPPKAAFVVPPAQEHESSQLAHWTLPQQMKHQLQQHSNSPRVRPIYRLCNADGRDLTEGLGEGLSDLSPAGTEVSGSEWGSSTYTGRSIAQHSIISGDPFDIHRSVSLDSLNSIAGSVHAPMVPLSTIQDLRNKAQLPSWAYSASSGVNPEPLSLLGIRVQLPALRCPSLPYLESASNSTTKGTRGNSFLLPSISLRLAYLHDNWLARVTGTSARELGTLSLSLKQFANQMKSEGPVPKPLLHCNEMFRLVSHKAPLYDVSVDIFSEMDGELLYDSDIQMGRRLRSTRLFFVQDDLGRVETFYLNAGDIFLNANDFHQPFTQPTLRVNIDDDAKGHLPLSRKPQETLTTPSTLTPGETYQLTTAAYPTPTPLSDQYSHYSGQSPVEQSSVCAPPHISQSVRSSTDSQRPPTKPVDRNRFQAISSVPEATIDEDQVSDGDSVDVDDIHTPLCSSRQGELLGEYRSVENSTQNSSPHSEVASCISSGGKSSLTSLKKKFTSRAASIVSRGKSTIGIIAGRERPLDVSSRLGWYSHEALRTFVRPVGHIISDDNPASFILARLQLLVRDPTDPRILRETFGIVVLKSLVCGEVVWRSNKTEYRCGGECVCVLRNYGDGGFCAVRVPSFDMRFPYENSFYVRRTLTERWQDLWWQAVRDEEIRRKDQQDKAVLRTKGFPVKQDKDEGFKSKAQALPTSIKEMLAGVMKNDGHALPIRVRRGQFLLRLKRTPYSALLDRPQSGWGAEDESRSEDRDETSQTKTASTTFLGITGNRYQYTDVAQQTRSIVVHNQREALLHKGLGEGWFDAMQLQRTVNLHHPLLWGTTMNKVATVKGNITVELLGAAPAADPPSSPRPPPVPSETDNASLALLAENRQDSPRRGEKEELRLEEDSSSYQLPLYQSWLSESVTLHMYVLTGRQLSNLDSSAIQAPYPSIQIGTEIISGPKYKSGSNTNPNFYHHFRTQIRVPGDCLMTLRVLDQLPRNVLGIDLGGSESATGSGKLESRKGGLVEEAPVDTSVDSLSGGDRALIGEVSIDLEERWLAYKRGLYSAAEADPYRRTEIKLIPYIHREETALEGVLGPLRPFPLEHLPLTKCYSSKHIGLPTGSIRFWVDFSQDGVAYEELPVQDLCRVFLMQLRVVRESLFVWFYP
eukprot:GHVQ01009919.1.p1 GENE.GHVQ01009919.1~~GHVQ01009919.1.p1  ORF type:complete len:2184 (-),score=244.58 GHVQ01009919.1:1654-8205(-)